MTRIAFAMEQSLGNTTHYLNLRSAEAAASWMQARWLPVDYRRTRVPWAVSGSFDAWRVLSPVMKEVEVAFVHTTTIGLLSPALRPHKPLVLSTDGTPNKRGMRSWYGLKDESPIGAGVKRALYGGVFRWADGFVAWCEWTKASLIEDYGVDASRIVVIPPGVDLDCFRPAAREHPCPRILFVGGDFVRKGGDLLLDVFRKRLRGRAQLELVTSAQVAPEPGVTVHRGLTANSPVLRELYGACDLFALPTRGEVLPLAGMEALAAGLPLVATRVGGLPELVRDGETGRLIDVDDAIGLGDALEQLVGDRALRESMSQAARREAAARFDFRTNARRVFEFARSHA